MAHITAPQGKIVVTLVLPEAVTDTGIVLPDIAQQRSTKGIVVASGVEDVETGDTVLIDGEYAGAAFEVDGVEYVSLLPVEVLGVLEGDDGED